MNFAVIENNIVTNIILADSKETAEALTNLTCVEYSDDEPVHVNDKWDGVKFTRPPVVIPEELLEATRRTEEAMLNNGNINN